ncbi:MAG: glycerol-3-phosphate acyltransferase [Bacteroidota bacterium]
MSSPFLLLVASYLIGTIPTAYLVVRQQSGQDIRVAGSGNVGAMNSYEVTGSRWTGLLVALGDALKGVLAVWLALGPMMPDGWTSLAAGGLGLLGCIAGHNYNAFLSIQAGKVSGGKGFATAAGGLLWLLPLIVPIWLAIVFLGREAFARWKGPKDMIPGSALATALSPLYGLALYGPVAALILAGFAALMLPKHVGQLRVLLGKTPDLEV